MMLDLWACTRLSWRFIDGKKSTGIGLTKAFGAHAISPYAIDVGHGATVSFTLLGFALAMSQFFPVIFPFLPF
jgi:hypothetical protein